MTDAEKLLADKAAFDLAKSIIDDLITLTKDDAGNMDYSHLDIGELSDITFACFAHLSYFDWHELTAFLKIQPEYQEELLKTESKKLELEQQKKLVLATLKNKGIPVTEEIEKELNRKIDKAKKEIKPKNHYKLNKILKEDPYFAPLKNEKYLKLYPPGQDYLEKKMIPHIEEDKMLEVEANIYKTDDARAFLIYSEDTSEPNVTPKYPEFGEWEFVYGFDHKSIWESMPDKDMAESHSGFQSGVFKNGNNIMIAYRGSDITGDNWGKDWYYTNLDLGMHLLPNSITCAVWVYNKVLEDFPESKIYITGHSMGGALAQYIGIYSDIEVKTVTWNALGIGLKHKIVLDTFKRIHYKKYKKNYDEVNFNPLKSNIINYYHHHDLTPNLQKRVGKIIVVDDNYGNYEDNGGSNAVKKLYKIFSVPTKSINSGDYHSVTNFIPYFDAEGNIRANNLSDNFMNNAIKNYINITNKDAEYEKEKVIKDLESVINKIKNSDRDSNDGEIIKYNPKNDEVKSNLFDERFNKLMKSYTSDWYKEFPKYIKLGNFNNFDSVGGVNGNSDLIIKIKEEVQNNANEEKNKENRTGAFIIGNTEIGHSGNIKKIGDNRYEEKIDDLTITYYYDANCKDLIVEWKRG